MPQTARIPRLLLVPFRGVAVAENVPPLKWKRRAVWDNPGRNKLIAAVAAGLARTARQTLRELGVEVDGVKLPGRSRQRVVVLTEAVEQARRLASLLPGWEVRDAVPVESEGAGWNREPDPDDDPPGKIATLVYTARNGIACDILVRATAGTGRLVWDVIRGGGNNAGTTPALVIDIADQVDDREDKDAATRRREYKEQGLEEARAATKLKTQNQNT